MGVHDLQPWEERLRKYMSWVAVVGTALFAIAIGIQIVIVAPYGFWNDVMKTHLPSVLGLPVAAVAALVIVLVLRTVSGAIELKILGLEFKGAAGPIIMWVICFLGMTLAITKTWDLGGSPREKTPATQGTQR